MRHCGAASLRNRWMRPTGNCSPARFERVFDFSRAFFTAPSCKQVPVGSHQTLACPVAHQTLACPVAARPRSSTLLHTAHRAGSHAPMHAARPQQARRAHRGSFLGWLGSCARGRRATSRRRVPRRRGLALPATQADGGSLVGKARQPLRAERSCPPPCRRHQRRGRDRGHRRQHSHHQRACQAAPAKQHRVARHDRAAARLCTALEQLHEPQGKGRRCGRRKAPALPKP